MGGGETNPNKPGPLMAIYQSCNTCRRDYPYLYSHPPLKTQDVKPNSSSFFSSLSNHPKKKKIFFIFFARYGDEKKEEMKKKGGGGKRKRVRAGGDKRIYKVYNHRYNPPTLRQGREKLRRRNIVMFSPTGMHSRIL